MKTTTHLLIAWAITSASVAPPVLAQDDYADTYKATYVKREALPIGDAQGHVMVLANAQASHRSTGRVAYFDGGEIEVKDVVDIVNGNGTHFGYITSPRMGNAPSAS